MQKRYWSLAIISVLFTGALIASSTRTLIVDQFKSSDLTKTWSLPTITDTLAGLTATQVFTGKTLAAGSNTITGLTDSNLSGTAGIANANLATMPTLTFKGNNTGGNATPSNLTVAQASAMFTAPTKQFLAAGSGATYTLPSGVRMIKVTVIGPGGGGGGSQGTAANSAAGGGGGGGGTSIKWYTSPSATYTYTLGSVGGSGGTTGNNAGTTGSAVASVFDSGGAAVTGGIGGGGNGGASTTNTALETGQTGGGTASGGDINIPGGTGGPGMVWGTANSLSGYGGASAYGLSVAGAIGADGSAGQNYGGGGSGGATTNSATGHAGGAGSKGAILVEEFYQ